MQLRGASQDFPFAFHTNGQCESRETSLLISPALLNCARERESVTFLGYAQ